jgi:hypothetical protein
MSLLFIFNSERVATKIVRESSDKASVSTDITHISILDISLKVVGIISLLSAIPYISDLTSKYWIMNDKLKILDSHGKSELSASILSVVLHLCAGFVLIFYSNILASKLCRTGLEATNTTDTDEM